MHNICFASLLPATARLSNVTTGDELDAAGLVDAVGERARLLSGAGIAHGQRVVVGCADPIRYIVDILACWKAGAVAVAVNPQLKPEEQQIVKDTVGAALWLDGVSELPRERRKHWQPAEPR